MKKPTFLFLLLGGIFFSCSTRSEQFESVAKELCSCMQAGQADAEDAVSTNVNIGFCLLDVEVDLKAEEMEEQVSKLCPEFSEGFVDYVRELK